MHRSFFSLLLFAIFLLPACNKKTAKGIAANEGALDQLIRVRYGSFVAIPSENLSISFDKIREGRCPIGVDCLQAGEANISMIVTKANQSESLVLTAKGNCQTDDGSCGQEKSILNYIIKLVKLDPYPGTEPQDKEFYSAYLMVTQNSGTGSRR
ncbi:MAG: hypothetical protein AAGD05_11570 [Bacteroidota bacterium]